MKNIETQLETLKDLLTPILTGSSPQKRKYANDLMNDLISELNKAEVINLNLIAKLDGFGSKDEYLTEYQKTLDILSLMGAGDIPYASLTNLNMRWISEHNEDQTSPFTFKQLYQTHRMLVIYESLENKMPESLSQLKDFFKKD